MKQETPKSGSQHEQGGQQSGQTGHDKGGQEHGQAQQHEKGGQQSGQQNVKSGSFKCKACSKSFNSESELREHEKTHKGQQ